MSCAFLGFEPLPGSGNVDTVCDIYLWYVCLCFFFKLPGLARPHTQSAQLQIFAFPGHSCVTETMTVEIWAMKTPFTAVSRIRTRGVAVHSQNVLITVETEFGSCFKTWVEESGKSHASYILGNLVQCPRTIKASAREVIWYNSSSRTNNQNSVSAYPVSAHGQSCQLLLTRQGGAL